MPLAHDRVNMEEVAHPMSTGDGMLKGPGTYGTGPIDSPELDPYPVSKKKYRLGSIGTYVQRQTDNR